MAARPWILGLVLAAGCGRNSDEPADPPPQAPPAADAATRAAAPPVDAGEPRPPPELPDIEVPEPILE